MFDSSGWEHLEQPAGLSLADTAALRLLALGRRLPTPTYAEAFCSLCVNVTLNVQNGLADFHYAGV